MAQGAKDVQDAVQPGHSQVGEVRLSGMTTGPDTLGSLVVANVTFLCSKFRARACKCLGVVAWHGSGNEAVTEGAGICSRLHRMPGFCTAGNCMRHPGHA